MKKLFFIPLLMLCTGCININSTKNNGDNTGHSEYIHPVSYDFENYNDLLAKYSLLTKKENPFLFNFEPENVTSKTYKITYWSDEMIERIQNNFGLTQSLYVTAGISITQNDGSELLLEFSDYKDCSFSSNSASYYDIFTNESICNQYSSECMVINNNKPYKLMQFSIRKHGSSLADVQGLYNSIHSLYQTFIEK